MKQKEEQVIDYHSSLMEREEAEQRSLNGMFFGTSWSLSIVWSLLFNGVQVEISDLQRQNPYDYWGISNFVVAQENYDETEKTVLEQAKELYPDLSLSITSVEGPVELTDRAERQSIAEMLEACPTDEVRDDIIKLMTVISKNEDLVAIEVEGYLRAIPFLIDVLSTTSIDKRELANYFASETSVYRSYYEEMRQANYTDEEIAEKIQKDIGRRLTNYVYHPFDGPNDFPEVISEQMAYQSFLEYFTDSPYLGSFKHHEYDNLYETTEVLMLADLIPREVLMEATVIQNRSMIEDALYKLYPDRKQIKTVLSEHSFDLFLSNIQPFYDAKFQTDIRKTTLWNYYRYNRHDRHNRIDQPFFEQLPIFDVELVKPCFNLQLMKEVPEPYLQVTEYDSYLPEYPERDDNGKWKFVHEQKNRVRNYNLYPKSDGNELEQTRYRKKKTIGYPV